MARRPLTVALVMFSGVFALFFFGPPLLSAPFAPLPLMKTGDVFDLLTPLVLLPLYWRLWRICSANDADTKAGLAFTFLAALWVLGQGMHLSANSIEPHLNDIRGSNAYVLAKFYDETLSHYLWHAGVAGLSAFLVFQEGAKLPIEQAGPLWPVIAAGVLHGFCFFAIVVEGGTPPLGAPFAALFVGVCLVGARARLTSRPALLFFFVTYMVALALFGIWGGYWHSLPQFSELGFIS